MEYSYSKSRSLGLKEIEFFSKDIDYDKKFYESHFLVKENQESDSQHCDFAAEPLKHRDVLKIWEEGGPVKVLPLPDFDAYPLYFTNFQELDYYQLKELLGNFFTLCEFENLKVRVTYKTEHDLRVVYKELKKDQRYNVFIFVDVGDYYYKQKDNVKKNNFDLPKNNKGGRLINQWINNGDVITETCKYNSYPIQIKNYNNFNYDKLMELFSKYGKFTTIAQMENECVQVKFCSEEAARKCVIDLKKDGCYNVRLLFFLKELNTNKKLVKEIVSSKLDAHIADLLNAEERIKFDLNQEPVKRQFPRVKQKNKNQEELQKTESTQIDSNVIYYKKNCVDGNVYVKGIPLENPYLEPPYSYKVWKNKQNHLPPPPPDDSDNNSTSKDVNYEYYKKNMKLFGQHSHPSCFGGALDL